MTYTNFEDLTEDMQDKVDNLNWKCSLCEKPITNFLHFKWLKSCDDIMCKQYSVVVNIALTKLTKAQIKKIMDRRI